MILIVMGVSGSGKSTIGAGVAAAVGWPFVDGDDLHPATNVAKMAAGHPLTDDERAPWLAAIGARMDEWLAAGRSGVIACSALRRSYRDTLRGSARRPDRDTPRDGVRFAFLDVDRATLAMRLRARHGHFMPAGLLDSQLATLEPPAADEDAITVKVDRSTSSDEIVRTLAATLRGEEVQ